MRITCPSCTAQYEVDAGLIPEDGRDVQCSACGHTWMQFGDGGVEEIADDAPPAPETTEHEAPAEVAPEPEAAASEDQPEGHVTAARVQRRELDSDARRILREEAQLEAARRRARRVSGTETQPDPGLEDRSSGPEKATDTVAEDVPDATRRRRGGSGMFPDIEEINSTLSAGEGVDRDPGDAPSAAGAGSFRSGFLLMVALAILIMALYLAAPWIAARVPALEPGLAAYVSGVNGFRMTVEGLLQSAAEWIDGLSA